MLAGVAKLVKELIALQRFFVREHSFDQPDEYQLQLQVLEDEVRTHVKTELQMKLHIDLLQERLESNQAKYVEQKELYRELLTGLDSEQQTLASQNEPVHLKEDFERFLRLSKHNQRLEAEVCKAKTELGDVRFQCKALHRQNWQLAKLLQKREAQAQELSTAEFFKQKYREATQQCLKTQALLKQAKLQSQICCEGSSRCHIRNGK